MFPINKGRGIASPPCPCSSNPPPGCPPLGGTRPPPSRGLEEINLFLALLQMAHRTPRAEWWYGVLYHVPLGKAPIVVVNASVGVVVRARDEGRNPLALPSLRLRHQWGGRPVALPPLCSVETTFLPWVLFLCGPWCSLLLVLK